MQFHLNGFRPGDPTIAEVAPGLTPPSKQLPKTADVLIVGCDPTGLTLAAQLAQFQNIRTVIVDQKHGPLAIGQADGVACRTMEMFEAFGFADRVLAEAYWVNETAFWTPSRFRRGEIARSGRIMDTEDGLSEFPHVILNQARVHDFYLDVMRRSPSRLEPSYGHRLLDIVRDEDAEDYPIAVRMECDGEGCSEPVATLQARYVVGCDGAHSSVRRALGLRLRGDSAHQAWGVMDVLAVTDFPDIRLKSIIRSADQGSMLIIPRGRILGTILHRTGQACGK